MHSEAWGDPRDPREHRGGHRMRMRMRGGPGGGPGPWGGVPFEFGVRGGPFGPPRFGGRGPRVRRGDVRAAILDLLAEGQPWNGYQIIQEIGARTQGVWRPSAGSVYPALQQLEDEGLIREEEHDGRKLYALTDAGRAFVDERAKEDRPAPWEQMSSDVSNDAHQLGRLMRDWGGDPEEAIASFRHVLRLDPERAEAHYEIGVTLERSGRKADALEEYRIAVEMAPCHARAKEALGRAALEAKQWSTASAQFRGVLALQPKNIAAKSGFDRAVSSERKP